MSCDGNPKNCEYPSNCLHASHCMKAVMEAEDFTPTNMDEAMLRHWRNYKIEGYGLEVTQHMPCPFCSAADFMVFKILEVREKSQLGAVCKECGRGCKAVYRDLPGGGVAFEFVQTVGDDAPSWYQTKMRREIMQ